MNVMQAVAAFMPVVSAFMREAEVAGIGGNEKREAVALASKQLYQQLQAGNTVKELKGVPWELVEPFLVPAAGGLITVLASMFNRLMGKVWGFLSRATA